MIIHRDDSKQLSLDEIRAFLTRAEPVEFPAKGRKQVYAWVKRQLVRYEYPRQGKAAKGLLWRYSQMTGLSMQQAKRALFRRIGSKIT
ncbi:MAG: hypothetical protein ACUVXB_04280 [Bryobacteraceae bacterium]